MATSEAGICNLALLRIGVTDTIDAPTDDSAEAIACRVLYPQARDVLLETRPWPFATHRATLAALDLDRDGWGYVYALPADCLVPRAIWSGVRAPSLSEAVPYVVEDDATNGRILLTDQDAAVLLYTAKLTAVGLFPPLFADALSWALAQDLATALPVKEGMQVRARQGYELALSRASAAVLNQQQPDIAPDSPTIAARWA